MQSSFGVQDPSIASFECSLVRHGAGPPTRALVALHPHAAQTLAVTDSDSPERRPDASARAAEDIVDAATGLDGRTWVTLRDLAVRPWETIRKAAFEHDPRYVGAVKLSLAMSTVAIVLMGWLLPSGAFFDRLRVSDPQAWAELTATLEQHGICLDHFADRFSSRYDILNTGATLVECGVFALVFFALDRSRPFISHLSFALYCYSMWLATSIPLQLLVAADIGTVMRSGLFVLMLLLLPGLLIVGLWQFYPAGWTRQIGRAVGLLVLTALLFAVSTTVIAAGAFAWTRASFGI